MRSDRLHWHLLTGFLLALGIYVGVFSCDQGVRKRKGPWEVSFIASTNGAPAILISQPFLGITNVQITFEGESATNSGLVRFDRPQQPLPFGSTKFEDLTYLPGSVTFDFFGHEVELLPRTLYLNKKEHGWAPRASHTLDLAQKLPPEAFVDSRKKKRRRPNQAPTNSATAPAGTR